MSRCAAILVSASPPKLEKVRKFDAQMRAFDMGGWLGDTREGEKLYAVLEENENIEALLHTSQITDIKEAKRYRGIAAATDHRVILVFNTPSDDDSVEMPYGSIESVTYLEAGLRRLRLLPGLTVTGSGTQSYQIDKLYKVDAEQFLECVRHHLKSR